jgi:hypothetical protein
MNSRTFSSFENSFTQTQLTLTAAFLAFGNIANLPPAKYNVSYPKPPYSIEQNKSSGELIVDQTKKSRPTHSSVDAGTLPFGLNAFPDVDSFSPSLIQGIQFIQNMAFIEVDEEIDRDIDTYFSNRVVMTKKLFINPYKKHA